jgi:hypothetical protein
MEVEARKKEKKNYVGSEALPISIKERRTPRAEALCVLLTRVKKKEVQRGSGGCLDEPPS